MFYSIKCHREINWSFKNLANRKTNKLSKKNFKRTEDEHKKDLGCKSFWECRVKEDKHEGACCVSLFVKS